MWRGEDFGESSGGCEANTTPPLGFSGGFLLSATSYLHAPTPTLLSLKTEKAGCGTALLQGTPFY